MASKGYFKLLFYIISFLIPSIVSAVELTHWPKEEAERINQLIKQHAHKGEFAVFDMDNTSYRHDLEEYLIPFLEKKGLLTREKMDASLKLIPFKDSNGEKESLYSYYLRLCEFNELVCYPWSAQIFSGFTLRELKNQVDDALEKNTPLTVKRWKNNQWTDETISPPQKLRGMQELFAKLQENGIRVYIMTAASEELVRMVASDKKYGYHVPPENVIGVNVLLQNQKTGELTTSRAQIKAGKYDQNANMDLALTTYVVNPMTWFEGKAGTILGWIDQWRKPILVGGDTLYSDTYMLLNSVDIDKGGLRLWINRNPKTHNNLLALQEKNVRQQAEIGLPATANKNWVIVSQDNLQ